MHVFLFNIGCIGCQVTWLFSAHVTTTSETFYFIMAERDYSVVFFNVNVTKIMRRHARKRIYKACKVWIDTSVPRVTARVTEWHATPSGQICLSIPDTHVRFLQPVSLFAL